MLKHLPNMITVLRIVMTPFFAWLYLIGQHVWSFLLLAAIMISDLVDGHLARKYHLQTKLGALLDPFADKLAQITICICLYLHHIAPLWFMIALILKEASQIVLAYICLRKKVEVQPARWYGKAATTLFYAVICFNLVFVPLIELPPVLPQILFVVAACSLYFAFINYIFIHLQVYNRQKKEQENNIG